MLPIKLIREQSEYIKKVYKKRNYQFPIEELLDYDNKKREITFELDNLRANRKKSTKNISPDMTDEEKQSIINSQKETSKKIHELEDLVRDMEEKLKKLLLDMPNILQEDIQIGKEENAVIIKEGLGNQVIKVTKKNELSKPPSEIKVEQAIGHWEIGKRFGIIDFERGVKVSGQRFYLLCNDGAKLQRSLINWMLDTHAARGYTEVYPPALVKEEMLIGTAQLPKFGENLYRDIEEDLWLVPTAEVPITNMYRDEILTHQSLPVKHVAYTPCFRREKMSAGKEVKGIKRGHQFDKVELVHFVRPEESYAAHEQLLEDSLQIIKELGLRYRVIQLASEDTSFASSKTYDIEVWAPGSNEWLEVSSVSNFLDFQARRANIRYKDEKKNNIFLHTLNGSGLALPRTLAAIIENNYDGEKIIIPTVLQEYMKKKYIS